MIRKKAELHEERQITTKMNDRQPAHQEEEQSPSHGDEDISDDIDEPVIQSVKHLKKGGKAKEDVKPSPAKPRQRKKLKQRVIP